MINLQRVFKKKVEVSLVKESAWEQAVPDTFACQKGIHIWKIKWSALNTQAYSATLSKAEYASTLHFRNVEQRRRAIIEKGVLKELSLKYLKTAPKSLNYKTDNHGRSFFTNHYNRLQFTSSHTKDYILIAFSIDQELVGINLAANHLRFNFLEKADQEFSKKEKESLASEHPSMQFFKIWTRKKALKNARSFNLKCSLREVDVLEESSDNSSSRLYFKTYSIDQEYFFSIAKSGPFNGVQYLEYTPAHQ